MEVPPPVKPPRGVKIGKETGGLLMSIIRTLSASETNEQREIERTKLEKDYKEVDQNLDRLVSVHDQDLTQVVQLFGNIYSQVSESREKIRKVKENLQACKTLLNCRRDELKKLWLEGLEYKYTLQLLDEIEQLSDVPNRLTVHLSQKQYLHATRLLVNSVTLGKDHLEDVKGLSELLSELDQKKQQLHTQLLDELKHHLYIRTSQEALPFRRQGSGRDTNALTSPFQRSDVRLSARQRTAKRNLFEASQKKSEKILDDMDLEDLDTTDIEEDSSHFMAILVKCFALLEKLPFAVEVLEKDMQNELFSIIKRTSNQVNEYIGVQLSGELKAQAKQSALLELVKTIFDQFRYVSQAHSLLLSHLSRAVNKYQSDVQLYEMTDFWVKVQAVLQLLLTDYLDMQNMSTDGQLSVNFSDSKDISWYFSRRKTQRKERGSLFKFDGSSSAMSLNSYMREMSIDGVLGSRDKILVCSPDPNNVTLIFIPLMCFIEEIEHSMGLKHGTHCALNKFLSEYVRETYLSKHRTEMTNQVNLAVNAADAWKAITLPDSVRDTKPLLLSTVTVDKHIQECKQLMRSLPTYGEYILQDVCTVLREYRDTCQDAYRGIVQPHSEDRRICSAAWLKDEDISRFLKSLPNWLNLKAQQEFYARTDRRRVLRRGQTEEESPEEVRMRNLREAEILASNLGEGGINSQEIISDMNLLKGLAQLQESMEWFSVRMLQFANEFRKEPSLSPSNTSETPSVSPSTLQALTSIAQDFDELANKCLLLLHLEVRVQCFHYLLAQGDSNKDSEEPDPKVVELSRVLASVDEAMSSSLHPRKCKYIFEGLGHLIAKILISSAQSMKKIDEAGIQRMCRNVFALQQALTNITMTRELALDHAKHYFELFYLTPEEILNGIVEKGPEFTELEYMNAFQLLNKSHIGMGAVNVHLERLSDILGEVGVTV